MKYYKTVNTNYFSCIIICNNDAIDSVVLPACHSLPTLALRHLDKGTVQPRNLIVLRSSFCVSYSVPSMLFSQGFRS